MSRVILQGIPVSAGISVGKAFFMNRRSFANVPRHTVPESLISAEQARLDRAFQLVNDELTQARDRLPVELADHASIIDSHVMISRDRKLLARSREIVHDMAITAEWALEKAVREVERKFEVIEDPYLRERIADVRLVAQRIIKKLLGQHTGTEVEAGVSNRVVLMAHDLSPADTIGLDISKIMSLATTEGGKTSHTGILARSLQIPALVGVTDLETYVNDGDLVIIDGLKGKLIVNPEEAELEFYSDLKYQFENYHKSIMQECHLPGETIDGYRINVFANVELFDELSSVNENGAEGVGLYRTEYTFLSRNELPTEEELTDEYMQMAQILGKRKVVFRSLDLGADKLARVFGTLQEPNPALGLRAIRFSMRHRDLFRRQLKAVLRASVKGNVALMFPMISGLNEIHEAKAVLREAQRELEAEGREYDPDMPVGIMVELPSTVFIADALAHEVDFFSVGTNDLIQYSLGIDRLNRHVSYLYQPLHPAVIRSIKYVVDAGHHAGIEVSVCGELASDPYCVPILLGMGVDTISITPQAIPGIKRIIRQTTMEDCKKLLKDVQEHFQVSAINHTVRESIFRQFPEELTFYASILDNEELPA
ncbi:phosphoenolpyruvate--protein phosphotransferase [Oceanidesulfovibrio marinus]|uniref:Phosphoenolpyruvate-protein phosphotransferase n=1 Tax=Oceanidesulfovibrio marinus TaxID=370038 RepID=A0A6P1ZKA8_9BACT|nr:phosphoenolpyruvate--protein phosphotransferase [Oceanidesulfovibrio marinus]QJT09199.1 phosphoenolpyruvate--protein phosphotransferase [Oceanidesulfovibrio marinus]TVM36371.1 phosphoenolpyruvate--protein phosphotransferase [Oceanidesulfovibrio marinus]